ncbi:hypothetical protein BSIN_4100 [Burkholderia singularis]|uniref:Uncharacterized protein n=1 Tax=Burkholderia singularis TaxID=1503053 RepID=A0A238HCS7_9BURK|nr:hypothetical protein BSIN_4100 [Burkholderia singularis]
MAGAGGRVARRRRVCRGRRRSGIGRRRPAPLRAGPHRSPQPAAPPSALYKFI